MKALLIILFLAALLFAGYHYVSLDGFSGVLDQYGTTQDVPED